jgi:DNA (cytosine-5)-methyltransferase 1
MPGISTVDVFCGIGGLTHGFVKEGLRVVAGIDADPTCKYAFEANNPGARFYEQDLETMSAIEVTQLFPEGDLRILVGCAPCQPFSRYSQRYAEQIEKEEKWRLVSVFGNIIGEVMPIVASMENVPELEKHDVFKAFTGELARKGYNVWHGVVNCAEYGVPQTRKRLVLLASRLGPISIIPKTHRRQRTVQDVIGNLPPIKAGEVAKSDLLHQASGLWDLNLRRLQHTPEGGTWRDWPEELILECHKKETGRSYGSIYGRMWWGKPAPTITTEFHAIGSGRFGHPTQDRALSLREGAMLQTFPKTYKFVRKGEDWSLSTVARHIGNAVPVRLGRVIARSIIRHLREHGS